MTTENQAVPMHLLPGASVSPSSVSSIDGDVVIGMIRKFDEPWAKELQVDLWLRTPTDGADPIPAAEQRPEPPARLGRLLPFLAVPIAFAAIALTLFKISMARRVNHVPLPGQSTQRAAYQTSRPQPQHGRRGPRIG